MNAIVDNEKLEAIKFLVALLHEHKVPYQFTGGLAGNIHGSKWPLQDIDLELPRAHIELVAYLLRKHIIEPLHFHQDSEFQIVMLKLKIGSTLVDINQIEAQQMCCEGKWLAYTVDLKKAELRVWQGMKVSVQPLDDLIAYKQLIGRAADLADLQKLKSEI